MRERGSIKKVFVWVTQFESFEDEYDLYLQRCTKVLLGIVKCTFSFLVMYLFCAKYIIFIYIYFIPTMSHRLSYLLRQMTKINFLQKIVILFLVKIL